MRQIPLAISAALIALPVMAQDQSPAERAHALRNAQMDLYVANIGPIFGMARGQVEYDADLASLLAHNLAAYASVDTSPLYVEGSSSDDLADSRALPAIWSNLDDVAAKQTQLADATAALAAASGEGQEAFMAAIKGVGDACSACHEAYRVPD